MNVRKIEKLNNRDDLFFDWRMSVCAYSYVVLRIEHIYLQFYWFFFCVCVCVYVCMCVCLRRILPASEETVCTSDMTKLLLHVDVYAAKFYLSKHRKPRAHSQVCIKTKRQRDHILRTVCNCLNFHIRKLFWCNCSYPILNMHGCCHQFRFLAILLLIFSSNIIFFLAIVYLCLAFIQE